MTKEQASGAPDAENRGPAEGVRAPEKSGVIGSITSFLGSLRHALGSLITKRGGITEDSIKLFRDKISLLPEGKYRSLFFALSENLDTMSPRELAQISQENIPDGAVVIDPEIINRDLLILLEGTFGVHVRSEKLLRAAPTVFGEMSTLTGGKPTAKVTSVGESTILRCPLLLIDKLRKADARIDEAIKEIIQERIRVTREVSAIQAKGLEPHQLMAELVALRSQNGDADRSHTITALLEMAENAGETFTVEDFPIGKTFISQGAVIQKVHLILDGKVNIFRHGARVKTATPGDFLGAGDAFTLGRVSQFDYRALDRVQTLSMNPDTFLLMRPKVEGILARQHDELKTAKPDTITRSSPELDQVPNDVLLDIHLKASARNTFVPLTPSGNELLFECGEASQMLCWLGVRELLRWRGTSDWKVVGETEDEKNLLITRPADATYTVPIKELAKENLKPAVHRHQPSDTERGMQTYVNAGLDFNQAQFLMEHGIVPTKNVNPLHLEAFRRSFPQIQEAMTYVAEWVQRPGLPLQNDYKGDIERQTVARELQYLLIDTSHQIGITNLMRHVSTRDMVLRELDKMLAIAPVDRKSFETFMATETGPLEEKFRDDMVRWNGSADAIRVKTSFKAALLLDERWGDIYRIGTKEPNARQLQKLQEYVDHLDANVCTALVHGLEDLLVPAGPQASPFPLITGRTKNVAGILNKVQRVRSGNRGKPPRQDFCVADLPDAVGARVIVENVEQLENAMQMIETAWKDRIIEKDDFYGNPAKNKHPYRLVTYTVECNGAPAEIQLQTLPSAIIATIDHDVIYKPYVPASFGERSIIESMQMRVAVAETQERLKPKTAGRSGEFQAHGERKRSAMRHMFQCATDSGSSICLQISEETPTWKQDVQAARAYFQWHESMRPLTMHKGSSATICEVGAPNWEAFKAKRLKSLRAKTTQLPAIDALVAEDADLFVLEALSEDVDTRLTLARFRSTILSRFPNAECAELEEVLALAQAAHAKQNYAIEDVDKHTKAPKYPSSLLLKDVPYWNHCVQIATLAAECGLSLDAVKAALLHDVIEDTAFGEAELSAYQSVTPRTLEMVVAVTRDKSKESREEYMARMATLEGEKKILKALDRYHNLLRAFNLRDSEKYLRRIVDESKDVFMGDFTPNAAISKYALRFKLLLDAVDRLRNRKFPALPADDQA